ncbi:hypothetical protein [Sporosarcina sp. P17b]|uniref:hypothetical protein n=1 Tax=Sporosarcina sp. P17b TaxID=2048260 RepID=UPI000C16FD7D|nr:hypothetical protein [Sporosarcina sp. P17b]PIC72892.1 hypothetical protein CSV76_12895 [Sporosarcina sp. P17b]
MYIRPHEIVDRPDFNKAEIKAMCSKAIDILNRNDNREERGRIIARIGLGIGRQKDDEEYMCSEFIDDRYKKLGIELVPIQAGL